MDPQSQGFVSSQGRIQPRQKRRRCSSMCPFLAGDEGWEMLCTGTRSSPCCHYPNHTSGALGHPSMLQPCPKQHQERCCSTSTRWGSQGGLAAAGDGVTRSQDKL